MNIMAIIPARGGSKGVPHKNILPLCGKPLIVHTIESALAAQHINRLVVSTDDAEIVRISRRAGAEVVWRPAEISDDMASSESALLHVLEYQEQNEGYTPDLVVFLQCTSPLTLPEDIDATIQTLLDEKADSALSVMPFYYFLWRKDRTGSAVGINHDKEVRLLRQEREPQFLETGAIYVMRAQGFKQAKHRFFGKTALHEMPPERCLEIDEPVDFQIAEMLLRQQQQKQRRLTLPCCISAVVLDFDGVFTDNRVLVFQDGREAVVCDRGDGWGMAQLKKLGIPILVLSSEENQVVQARCDKLGIAHRQGIQDKLAVLTAWLKEHNIAMSQVIYVGNDVNDLACLKAVGCGIAVGDAYPQVQTAAHIVLSSPGGRGAIREVAELIEDRLEEKGNAING